MTKSLPEMVFGLLDRKSNVSPILNEEKSYLTFKVSATSTESIMLEADNFKDYDFLYYKENIIILNSQKYSILSHLLLHYGN